MSSVNAQNYEENKTFLESVPSLSDLTFDQKDRLVLAMTSYKFESGERIVNEGDPGDLFFLIKDGEVSCTQKGTEIRRLGKGDFFGEMALLYDSPRTATVTAIGEVK